MTMSKKYNIVKDLKKLNLVPTKKKQNQMLAFGAGILVLAIIALSLYGMYKYPIPPHYYDTIGDPTIPYRNIAFYECPCGNDPECWPWEPRQPKEKYAYYV